jgi:hypothetical protein
VGRKKRKGRARTVSPTSELPSDLSTKDITDVSNIMRPRIPFTPLSDDIRSIGGQETEEDDEDEAC